MNGSPTHIVPPSGSMLKEYNHYWTFSMKSCTPRIQQLLDFLVDELLDELEQQDPDHLLNVTVAEMDEMLARMDAIIQKTNANPARTLPL